MVKVASIEEVGGCSRDFFVTMQCAFEKFQGSYRAGRHPSRLRCWTDVVNIPTMPKGVRRLSKSQIPHCSRLLILSRLCNPTTK